MTLTRPAYTITVENLSAGWSLTATAGDEPDLEARVVLLDQLRHSWGFTDGVIPGPLEPASVTFRLGAYTAADLPELSPLDLYRVSCSRPLAGWPADPDALTHYFQLEGRLADPELDLDPHARRSVVATVTLTDLNAELAGRTPQLLEGQYAPGAGDAPQSHALAAVSGFNFLDPTPVDPIFWEDPFASPDFYPTPTVRFMSFEVGATLADLIGFRISTMPLPDTDAGALPHTLFPRGRVIDPTTVPTTPPPGRVLKWRRATGSTENPVAYFLETARRLLPERSGALRLVWSVETLSVKVTGDAADKPLDIGHARACIVRTPVAARKAREHAINRLEVEAVGDPMLAPEGGWEQAVVTRSRRPITEFGTVARRLVTAVTYWFTNSRTFGNAAPGQALLPRLVEAYLPDPPAAETSWGYDGLEVCTWLMSDAELDAQAAQYWPAYPDAGTPAPGTNLIRQIVVSDPDPSVLVAGDLMAGALVGAEHEVAAGRIVIRPQLAPLILDYNPAASDLLSPADLIAAGAPWSLLTPAAFPGLTPQHFRLIGQNL